MTTQPSDWAVARAFRYYVDSPANWNLHTAEDFITTVVRFANELEANAHAPSWPGDIEVATLIQDNTGCGDSDSVRVAWMIREAMDRARELDASGGGSSIESAALEVIRAHLAGELDDGMILRLSSALATPRAAEAGDDTYDLADLHDSLRIVYEAVPTLPITAETMDAATDALHEFCLLIGIHKIETGPYDKAMGAAGAGHPTT